MITVIGAAGHLGNVLTQLLVKKNEKLRVIVFPSENYDCLKLLPVEIVPCDIRNRSALDLAVNYSPLKWGASTCSLRWYRRPYGFLLLRQNLTLQLFSYKTSGF
jgi:nucleoside-diphosphate-sugar epimerase